MGIGLFERILTRRYGQPSPRVHDGLMSKCWNEGDQDREARLYFGMKWHGLAGLRFAPLREIYGNSYGGVLIKDTLKAAVLLPRQLFAVWNIDELRSLPAVQHAVLRDPGIHYFMDQHNVLYYGVKAGQLYVFDTVIDELDPLGPVDQAIETLMDEWEAVCDEPLD